jgi:hypothetical protein
VRFADDDPASVLGVGCRDCDAARGDWPALALVRGELDTECAQW